MTTDMERELRDMMTRTADAVDHIPRADRRLVRRARLRQLRTGLLAATAAVALVFGGLAGARSLSSDQATSPADTDSEGTFADVHGWITYRSGSELRAVDPSEPGQTISLDSYECPFDRAGNGCSGANPIGWSLDGARLLISWSGVGKSLAVLEDDGTSTLVDGPLWASFSPDGSQLAYSLGRWRGPYIEDIDSGTRPPFPTRATDLNGHRRSLGDPCKRQKVQGELMELCGEPAPEAAAWSPDGSTIAWLDLGEGTIPGAGHENFLSFVNPDGTGLREGVAQLPGTFGGESLVWSPDGSRLVFWMADESDRNAQIFVINADGTGLRQITDEGENRWPVWSPDGSRIAFVRDGSLHTMAPDGSDVQELDGVSPDGSIAWNPVPRSE